MGREKIKRRNQLFVGIFHVSLFLNVVSIVHAEEETFVAEVSLSSNQASHTGANEKKEAFESAKLFSPQGLVRQALLNYQSLDVHSVQLPKVSYESTEKEKESTAAAYLDTLVGKIGCQRDQMFEAISRFGGQVARMSRFGNKIYKEGLNAQFLERFLPLCEGAGIKDQELQNCLEKIYQPVSELHTIIWEEMSADLNNDASVSSKIDERWKKQINDSSSNLAKTVTKLANTISALKSEKGVAIPCVDSVQESLVTQKMKNNPEGETYAPLSDQLILDPVFRKHYAEMRSFALAAFKEGITPAAVFDSMKAYYTYTDTEFVISQQWKLSEAQKAEKIAYYKTEGEKITKRNLITIVDMSKDENEERFFHFNLETFTSVIEPQPSAHGYNSGRSADVPKVLKDARGCTPPGLHVTADVYSSRTLRNRYGPKHERALQLIGLENRNDGSFGRGVVIHSTPKTPLLLEDKTETNSGGCPTLSLEAREEYFASAEGGSAVYIYGENYDFKI